MVYQSPPGTYLRQVIYPDLPLPLEEIYYRTAKYTGKLVSTPPINVELEFDADIRKKRGSLERCMTVPDLFHNTDGTKPSDKNKKFLAPTTLANHVRRGSLAIGAISKERMPDVDFRRFTAFKEQAERDE